MVSVFLGMAGRCSAGTITELNQIRENSTSLASPWFKSTTWGQKLTILPVSRMEWRTRTSSYFSQSVVATTGNYFVVLGKGSKTLVFSLLLYFYMESWLWDILPPVKKVICLALDILLFTDWPHCVPHFLQGAEVGFPPHFVLTITS